MEATLSLFHDDQPDQVHQPEGAIEPSLHVVVYGTAQPAGSKRVVPIGKKGGPKRWIATDANAKSRPWKNQVAQVVGEAMAGRALLDGPLAVTFRFFRRRPAGHYRKGGALNAAGRRSPFPAVRPDALKLARGVEDALSGVVYRDDAQIVHELLTKEYGEPERVEITVTELGMT